MGSGISAYESLELINCTERPGTPSSGTWFLTSDLEHVDRGLPRSRVTSSTEAFVPYAYTRWSMELPASDCMLSVTAWTGDLAYSSDLEIAWSLEAES